MKQKYKFIQFLAYKFRGTQNFQKLNIKFKLQINWTPDDGKL